MKLVLIIDYESSQNSFTLTQPEFGTAQPQLVSLFYHLKILPLHLYSLNFAWLTVGRFALKEGRIEIAHIGC